MTNVRFNIGMKYHCRYISIKSFHHKQDKNILWKLTSSQAWIWHLLWILLGSAWPLHPCEGQIWGLRLPPRRKSSLQCKRQVWSGHLMLVLKSSFSKIRYSTHLYGEEAVRIIEERKAREETKKPFFLYLPFQALHAPMQVIGWAPLLQQDYIGAHRVRDQVQRPQGEQGEDARAGDDRRHGWGRWQGGRRLEEERRLRQHLHHLHHW